MASIMDGGRDVPAEYSFDGEGWDVRSSKSESGVVLMSSCSHKARFSSLTFERVHAANPSLFVIKSLAVTRIVVAPCALGDLNGCSPSTVLTKDSVGSLCTAGEMCSGAYRLSRDSGSTLECTLPGRWIISRFGAYAEYTVFQAASRQFEFS